jgi:hypothetical protein
LEVADIFRTHGPAWRKAQHGHLSLGQLKVMSAIEQCRTAALVYAKRPFAGPAAVLAYLSRYTHRVAISNSRLISMNDAGVTFRWKDYRATGKTRHKTMTLEPDEFMRRFLLHVLPSGFHRIRHYGLIANNARKENLALARELLQVAPVATSADADCADALNTDARSTFVCSHCGSPMVIVRILLHQRAIRAPPQNSGGP